MTHLLVVDDNREVAEAVALALDEAGYETSIAVSLPEARTRLQEGLIDGAIVDVWMNSHSGLDFASELAQHTPPLPFVIMSGGGPGKTLESVTARADSLGAAAVLYKPFEDDELLAAVKVMLKS